jgi:4-amino-4-deoxy-L-arabinose transferase-like glycosyltransferase
MKKTSTTPPLIDRHGTLIVIAVAAAIFLCGVISPPSLLDDVDAVHGAIARTMLRSGDWITARINGVVYLDKAPLTYWLIAASYAVFGIHDWAARLPIALGAIAVSWLTCRIGAWAFSRRAGFYAGLVTATCIGLYLFTRILIPEMLLTFTVALSLWAFLRLQEAEELSGPHRRRWTILFGVGLGAGLLLKGLLGLVAPAGAICLYLLATRRLWQLSHWRETHLLTTLTSAVGVGLLIAAPWYVAATLANPPYFDFTLQSGEGVFRGFFWRYFINEHLLRYLGERLPKDYDTVPLLSFWLLHIVWLFPWSFYAPAAAKSSFSTDTRPGSTRLMAVCWAVFLLAFFSFSTSQEYYTMPIYPALALLIGSALSAAGEYAARGWLRYGTAAIGGILALAAGACIALLLHAWSLPAEGDISSALVSNPDAYTLSLGHMSDLTLDSFAYLRRPLALAALAFLIGAAGCFVHFWKGRRAAACQHGSAGPPWLAFAVMMLLFTSAARIAMVAFDPYLSSRPLADALREAPPGKLVIHGAYYPFSSVVFYADREALLLNGRFNNLEYGSNAPGAPEVFIDIEEFRRLWSSGERVYLLTTDEDLRKGDLLTGNQRMLQFATAGGKSVLTNTSLPIPDPPPTPNGEVENPSHIWE